MFSGQILHSSYTGTISIKWSKTSTKPENNNWPETFIVTSLATVIRTGKAISREVADRSYLGAAEQGCLSHTVGRSILELRAEQSKQSWAGQGCWARLHELGWQELRQR